jgi:TetR/AcrR family transcriptional repressor of bet genes
MPKLVDHQERREEIADAVCTVVAREGLEGATVREIARTAGCSTGVLAHYVPDKPALLGLALTTAGDRTAERMRRHQRKEPALEALRAVAREALPLDDKGREEWQVWLAFWGRAIADPELATLQRERYEGWRETVEELIDRGRRDGSLREDLDPAVEACLLVAELDGLGIQAIFEPDRFPPRRLRQLLDRLLSRIAPDDAA